MERLKLAKRINSCYICLRKGHLASDCSGSNCHCGYKHHPLLHREMSKNARSKTFAVRSFYAQTTDEILDDCLESSDDDSDEEPVPDSNEEVRTSSEEI